MGITPNQKVNHVRTLASVRGESTTMTERQRWFETKGTVPEHDDWRSAAFRETETDIDPDGNPTGDTP